MKTNVLLQGETRVRIPSAVKPLMSVAFITLGFMLLATVAFAVGETNGFVFTHQGRRLAYEWYIPESSILQTPEWDIDTTPCPLAPDRAWQTAKAWLTTHDRKGSTLVRIQIEPFIRQGEGHQAEKKYGRR
ncbi:MAG: hypothetical protein NTW03_18145 [Verrucomicrobia bacterium]|nr:hypothetical protein [Verrucomicrobiota bacterium]